MGTVAQFPNPLPLPAVGRIAALLVERHSPAEIANAIDVLVDLLDFLVGDPDDEDGNDAEDDFALSPRALALSSGPGCTVSDPKEQDDDSGQATEDEVSYGDPGFGMRGPGDPISDPPEGNEQPAMMDCLG